MRTSLLLIANERDQLKHKIEEMEKSQRRIALKKSMRTQQMQQLKSKLELLQQQNVGNADHHNNSVFFHSIFNQFSVSFSCQS